MDTADRISEHQSKQTHAKVDPLRGVNLQREYALIDSGESLLAERIQRLIVMRVEEGR